MLLRPLEVLFPLHVQSDLVPIAVDREEEQEAADGERALLVSYIHPASINSVKIPE